MKIRSVNGPARALAGCLSWLLLIVPQNATAIEEAVGEIGVVEQFDFDGLIRRAEVLASTPFEDEDDPLPETLQALDYASYGGIAFRPEHALWRDKALPFEVEFFHRGYLFERRVDVNVLDGGELRPVAFSTEYFEYGEDGFTENLPDDLGFAGFRLHYPLNRYDHHSEFIVFLGASYFRAIGQDQVYGVSSRGLALNTGRTEEFPFFREFWIERPAPMATRITVYALLDGQSVTGAYRFDIRPGWETVITVDARIFTRQKVETLGLAPLTSMFWYGKNTARPEWERRPAVHDSDGLLMAAGSGELLWRPLDNPETLRISAFDDLDPRGFGLLQREREFNSYRDLWALYHRRPSVWVEPIGDWGEGAVELIEIPTVDEYVDNIVAAWVPTGVVGPGEERAFAYRLRFGPDAPAFAPAGRTTATRLESGTTRATRFVLNFDGAALRALDATTPPEAVVRASSGRIANEVIEKDEATDGWRISFDLLHEDGKTVELSCLLTFRGTALTETWRYSWDA